MSTPRISILFSVLHIDLSIVSHDSFISKLGQGLVVSDALVLERGDNGLILLVIFTQVAYGEDGPLVDEGVLGVDVALLQNDGDPLAFSHLKMVQKTKFSFQDFVFLIITFS